MTESDKNQKFRRTNYFTSVKFQLRYVGLILMCMFIAAGVCTYTVYCTGTAIFAEKLSSVYPQGRLVALINSVNYNILGNILLLIPAIVLIALYLSHKIAGPIYRIERYLSDMAAGKLTTHITLRKGDEFGGVATKINVLTDSLRTTISSQRASLDKILAELEYVKKLADSKTASIAEVDKNIDTIDSEIRVLEKELDRFKV